MVEGIGYHPGAPGMDSGGAGIWWGENLAGAKVRTQRLKHPQTPDYAALPGPAFGLLCGQVQPVQKQTRAGQRTRFKAFVLVGDFNGHVGLGVKVGKEVANAIRGAILAAKMEVIPVRRGYWGNKLGMPHTVAVKMHAKCGSVHIRVVPAPRGTGIVAAPTAKKILQYAGVNDCFTQTRGTTMTLGNFAKATFYCLKNLYGYLEPTLWNPTRFGKAPFQEFTDELSGAKVSFLHCPLCSPRPLCLI